MNRPHLDATLGIVASSAMRRQVLQALAQELGLPVRSFSVEQLLACLQDEADVPSAWVLDADAVEVHELLEQISHRSDAPFLVNEEAPPPPQSAEFDPWRRRMLDKMDELVASVAAAPWAERKIPAAVWVLAASTGGPEAVSQFLAALTPGLPIALVYVQHIEERFDQVLATALARHEHYAISLCRGEQHLLPGTLLLVPADRQLRFLPFHRVMETRKRWEGLYQPAIDQVVVELGRLYQKRCGAIIFSGLCDDGARGCKVLQALGGEVWVQSPDSCVSPSMPNAALATGVVTRQGTPQQLARELSSRYAA